VSVCERECVGGSVKGGGPATMPDTKMREDGTWFWCFWVQDLGLRVWGFEFGVWGLM
jgi:hypothetical protein